MKSKKIAAWAIALVMVFGGGTLSNVASVTDTGVISAAAESDGYIKAAFEPQVLFVAEDRNGNEYVIPGMKTEDKDAEMVFSVSSDHKKLTELAGTKDIYEVKAIIRAKDMDPTKTYALKATFNNGSFTMPSYSYYGDDLLGCVLHETYMPIWQDEYVFQLGYSSRGATHEDDEKVDLSITIDKASTEVHDMSDSVTQFIPENRQLEHKLKYGFIKGGFDFKLQYYAVDKDGNKYPIENTDTIEETNKYIFINNAISGEALINACDPEKFDHIELYAETGDMGGKTTPFDMTTYYSAKFKDDGEKHYWGYSYVGSPYLPSLGGNESAYLQKLDMFGNSANADAHTTDIDCIKREIVIDKSAWTVAEEGEINISDDSSSKPEESSSKPDSSSSKPENSSSKPDSSSSKPESSSSKPDSSSSKSDDSSKPEDKFTLGDVNGDNDINVTDIAVTASHIKGIKALDENGIKAADVDKSGEVNVTDISKIAAHIKGIKALGS